MKSAGMSPEITRYTFRTIRLHSPLTRWIFRTIVDASVRLESGLRTGRLRTAQKRTAIHVSSGIGLIVQMRASSQAIPDRRQAPRTKLVEIAYIGMGPENGGLVPLGGFSGGVFRIDHDQAYQQTVVTRYQRPHNREWIDFTWRYDSGLVVSGVPDVASALILTAAEQATIGFSCGGVYATFTTPITSCSGIGKSTLLTLPQTGTENDDHNPDRVKPRNLFNAGIGTDKLFHKESGPRWTLRFTVENLTNKVALYNFLSTFSGTHFVAPRTYQASLGYAF